MRDNRGIEVRGRQHTEAADVREELSEKSTVYCSPETSVERNSSQVFILYLYIL